MGRSERGSVGRVGAGGDSGRKLTEISDNFF
jgi:hypothetical protein